MARKSRKPGKIMPAENTIGIRPKNLTGLYARLSVEDNGYQTKESIQNQIALLKGYVEQHTDELQLVDVYVDNGASGANFERVEWNRLIDDVQSRRINCIIVKDFSRIGRAYIEVGNYLEKVFPFLGVRVIALNENYDSQKQSFQGDMLVNSLKNIVNEYYARDISKKVSQAKKTIQQQGEYVSGLAPYGYKKTENRRLVVDMECAIFVKQIFAWRAQGKGCHVIANYLNELAVPSPGRYRYMNGCMAFKKCCNAKWKSSNVSEILKNPVYLGHMIQGKTRTSYFEQNGKVCRVPQERWIVVENTHEALITQEQFNIAAAMAKENHQKYVDNTLAHANVPRVENPLRAKVYCGLCGRHMVRRSLVKHQKRCYWFQCQSGMRYMESRCSTRIYEGALMDTLQETLKPYLKLLGVMEGERNARIFAAKTAENSIDGDIQIKRLKEEISRNQKQRQDNYVSLKDNRLSFSAYEHEKSCLEEQKKAYESELKEMEHKREKRSEFETAMRQCRSGILSMKDDKIPWDIWAVLIDRINVFSPQKIEITFSFSDEIKRLGGG